MRADLVICARPANRCRCCRLSAGEARDSVTSLPEMMRERTHDWDTDPSHACRARCPFSGSLRCVVCLILCQEERDRLLLGERAAGTPLGVPLVACDGRAGRSHEPLEQGRVEF